MSAYTDLLAALAGSPELHPGEAERLVADLLNWAADVLEAWPGDQTPEPEDERPGYDGPTITPADRLDECLDLPREGRERLIADHRQMVVAEVTAELRRMATAGRGPAPKPGTTLDEAIRERAADFLACENVEWEDTPDGMPPEWLVDTVARLAQWIADEQAEEGACDRAHRAAGKDTRSGSRPGAGESTRHGAGGSR